MDITHAWLFVYLFVLDSFSSAELYRYFEELPALYITNGHFRVLKQHPALKKCAIAIAKEVKYAALRVNEQTGECQGLPSQWLDNQMIERGYAYAKRVNLKEDFEPPVTLDGRLNWLIHGMFKEGSKLDMFISIAKPHDPLIFAISLNTEFDVWASGGDFYTYRILIKSEEIGNTVEFAEERSGRNLQNIYKNFVNSWPAVFSSGKVFKISVLANAGAITVLVDDEEFCTFKTINNVPMYELGLTVDEMILGTSPYVLYGIEITVE